MKCKVIYSFPLDGQELFYFRFTTEPETGNEMHKKVDPEMQQSNLQMFEEGEVILVSIYAIKAINLKV